LRGNCPAGGFFSAAAAVLVLMLSIAAAERSAAQQAQADRRLPDKPVPREFRQEGIDCAPSR
jgi:hypothetical protein